MPILLLLADGDSGAAVCSLPELQWFAQSGLSVTFAGFSAFCKCHQLHYVQTQGECGQWRQYGVLVHLFRLLLI